MKRRLQAIVLAFAMTLTVCTARVYSQTAEAAETDSPEIAIQVSDEGSLDLSNDDIPESSVTDLEETSQASPTQTEL